MEQFVPIILAALQIIEKFVLPNLGASSGAAANVITILEQVVPLAVQLGTALLTPIKNIIAGLRASGAVTPEQLDQLDAFEAQLDADFDAAAAAAEAEDAGNP